MEKNTLGRIKEFVEQQHLSVNAFAKAIGMQQATVNNYFICSRKLSYEFVDSILEHYKELSAEWLIRGTGEMFIEQPTDEASLASKVREQHELIKRQQREIDGLYERIKELKKEGVPAAKNILSA